MTWKKGKLLQTFIQKKEINLDKLEKLIFLKNQNFKTKQFKNKSFLICINIKRFLEQAFMLMVPRDLTMI